MKNGGFIMYRHEKWRENIFLRFSSPSPSPFNFLQTLIMIHVNLYSCFNGTVGPDQNSLLYSDLFMHNEMMKVHSYSQHNDYRFRIANKLQTGRWEFYYFPIENTVIYLYVYLKFYSFQWILSDLWTTDPEANCKLATGRVTQHHHHFIHIGSSLIYNLYGCQSPVIFFKLVHYTPVIEVQGVYRNHSVCPSVCLCRFVSGP